jgi:hypothetical protein
VLTPRTGLGGKLLDGWTTRLLGILMEITAWPERARADEEIKTKTKITKYKKLFFLVRRFIW